MEELRHLQRVLLFMLEEIDKLCKRNGIEYYLSGGNALGAIRHKGFIPWDDDLDIMLMSDDYSRFIEACRRELDPDKWFVQEEKKDWYGYYSKIRLKGTFVDDIGEWDGLDKKNRGIFIDVFRIAPASKYKIGRYSQYFCDKLLTSYSLLMKGYKSDELKKKIMLALANALRVKGVRNLCENIVNGGDKNASGKVFCVSDVLRLSNFFIEKGIFGKPRYVEFEKGVFPVPEKTDEYLKKLYGDYMKLPPIDQQKPPHSQKIEFGKY